MHPKLHPLLRDLESFGWPNSFLPLDSLLAQALHDMDVDLLLELLEHLVRRAPEVQRNREEQPSSDYFEKLAGFPGDYRLVNLANRVREVLLLIPGEHAMLQIVEPLHHAARLAYAHPRELLVEAIGEFGEPPAAWEFLTDWVVERALRHDDVGDVPAVEALWTRVAKDSERKWLVRLPFQRLEVERHLPALLPVYDPCGRELRPAVLPRAVGPTLPAGDEASEAPALLPHAAAFSRRSEDLPGAVESAFASISKIEIRRGGVFTGLSRTLAAVRMAVKAVYADQAQDLHAVPVSAEEVTTRLYECSRHRVERPMGNVWARRSTWESLKGMAGVSDETSMPRAEEAIRKTDWLWLENPSYERRLRESPPATFYRVFRSISLSFAGVVAFREDGSAAVLTAKLPND